VAAIGLATACATTRFAPPEGAAAPAPDGAARWSDATRACAAVTGYHAQLRLSGRLAGHGMPGITVGLALTRDGRIGLEARAGGPSLFVLGGRADDATLALTSDRRLVTAPAADIVDALVGVALGPARLLAVMTGCVSPDLQVADVRAYEAGATMAVRLASGDVAYLVRGTSGMVVRAGAFDGVQVEYRDRFASGWPRRIEIRTEAGRVPAVSLSMRIESVEIDPTLADSVFVVARPSGWAPLSIGELRASGPLGDSRRGG
jgi:hypothetical protein